MPSTSSDSLPPIPPVGMPMVTKAESGTLEDDVLRAWLSLATKLGFSDAAFEPGRTLIACYKQPHRHYHNLQHLRECLDFVARFADLAFDLPAVEAAIFFHDAVYEVGAVDNELRSADMARDTLTTLGLRRCAIERIAKMILDTRHTAEPLLADAKLVCDADLSILAQGDERYAQYAAAIAAEANLPKEVFVEKRTQFLKHMLERPTIFWLEKIRAQFESKARRNMARELEALSHGG